MKLHCLATSLLLLSTGVLLAGGPPRHTPRPSQPGFNLNGPSMPNFTMPGMPNVNVPAPNFSFNPGQPSVSNFGGPSSYPTTNKPHINLQNYPGAIGQQNKPFNTSRQAQAPGAGNGPPAPQNKWHSHAGIWHHHKWIWIVGTGGGDGCWQDAGVAAPDDMAQALDDPTASDDSQAASGAPQTRRYFRLRNSTGTRLTIHVAYQTLNQQDEWVWSDVLSYQYDPDEENAISDSGWTVNAVRAPSGPKGTTAASGTATRTRTTGWCRRRTTTATTSTAHPNGDQHDEFQLGRFGRCRFSRRG